MCNLSKWCCFNHLFWCVLLENGETAERRINRLLEGHGTESFDSGVESKDWKREHLPPARLTLGEVADADAEDICHHLYV